MSVSQAIQQQLSPQAILDRLQQGNVRFVSQKQRSINYQEIREHNAHGQYPLAFILCCVDSRVAPEIIFDQTLGDIFVGRVAGNVVDDNILGSMEFATKLAGAKLIMILGHTGCGAVSGACQNIEMGHLTQLIEQIKPSVQQVLSSTEGLGNIDIIDTVAKHNVLHQMSEIRSRSAIISALIDKKKIIMVGAMHDITSGHVNLLSLTE